MNLDEFREYINDKNQEATVLLKSLTSEADRLNNLNSLIKNAEKYEYFLRSAKAITDDAQGDIDQINAISDEIFNHGNRDEFYSDCYMDFLSLNFILRSCVYQASRIEDTAKHIANKYGVLFQYGQGMEFSKIIVTLPNFNDVIKFIAGCNDQKRNEMVTPEDKEIMIEKEVEDLNVQEEEDNEDDYDHVIGIVGGKEDLPKHPFTYDIHQVYVSYDKDTNTVTTWYFDHHLMDWNGESWELKETTFEDYVQSVKVDTKFTPNGLKIFGFAHELNDLPIHNMYNGAIWAVQNGRDKEFNPMYIYYAWDETEDGTPYYCGFTGDKNLWGGTSICTVSWNGSNWVDSVVYSYSDCQFIDVSRSFNEVNSLDDCNNEVYDAVGKGKIPIKVLYLDHEDGNTTIEPYAYNDGLKKWVRAIPITYAVEKCTEEFVHDWKEAHNK